MKKILLLLLLFSLPFIAKAQDNTGLCFRGEKIEGKFTKSLLEFSKQAIKSREDELYSNLYLCDSNEEFNYKKFGYTQGISRWSQYKNHTLTYVDLSEEGIPKKETEHLEQFFGWYIDGIKVLSFQGGWKKDKNNNTVGKIVGKDISNFQKVFPFFKIYSPEMNKTYIQPSELKTIDAFFQKFTSKKENISKIPKIIEKISAAQKKVEKKESTKEKRIYEILSYIRAELKIIELKEYGINAK